MFLLKARSAVKNGISASLIFVFIMTTHSVASDNVSDEPTGHALPEIPNGLSVCTLFEVFH